MLFISLPRRLVMVILHGQNKMFCLSFVLFPNYQIPKIIICHMVVSGHTEVIEGQRLIATYVFDSEEAAEDVSFDNYSAASYE